MALAHELKIAVGAVFPLLRTCLVSDAGTTDVDLSESLQAVNSAEEEWLAQGARVIDPCFHRGNTRERRRG